MTLFGRKKKTNEPTYVQNSAVAAVADYPVDYQKQQARKTASPSLSGNTACDVSEEGSEQKPKPSKYQIVCLPLDTRSGRVLLVTKADDASVWVMPKFDVLQTESPENIAHGIAVNIAGVQGRLTSHVGEFTQKGKKRVKAYITAYEFQVTSMLNEYECQDTRGRRWFTYVDAMQTLSDKPFQQNILRRTSIAPKF